MRLAIGKLEVAHKTRSVVVLNCPWGCLGEGIGHIRVAPGLYQNEVKCSAFDVEMIFHSHANKTHFHKKGCALGLILKVRGFGTRNWSI